MESPETPLRATLYSDGDTSSTTDHDLEYLQQILFHRYAKVVNKIYIIQIAPGETCADHADRTDPIRPTCAVQADHTDPTF